MRKILLFILIFSVASQLPAQPFSNYIDSTSRWSVYAGGSDFFNTIIYHYQYSIKGDTTIGGKDYFKLYVSGVDSIFPNDSSAPSANLYHDYAGALSEDASGKLHFIYATNPTEYLLYDFNLSVGSYLQDMQPNYSCNNPPLQVASFDTLYLGAQVRKRFLFTNQFIQGIIEGVGSGGGLIETSGMCLGYEHNSNLVCYRKGSDMMTVYSHLTCELTASGCSAYYNLVPDTIPHRYFAVNMASGASSLSYLWQWGDGSFDSIPFPSHTYDSAGFYTICLRISDSLGCADTYCNSYNLLRSGAIIEINVIPPVSTGIEDRNEEFISIFPNPSADFLNIALPNMHAATIKIFNTEGRMEIHSETTAPTTSLDISGLQAGFYIVEVHAGERIFRQKFIKE